MLADPTQLYIGVTIEDYLNRPDTNQPMEFDDDKVMILNMPTPFHQELSYRLVLLLSQLIPNGRIYFAPVDVKLGGRVYQPDLLWVKGGGLCSVTPKYLDGAPALVIEILSPSTKVRDRREKRKVYGDHGVEEYWLVDPDGGVVEVFTLSDGHLAEAGVYSYEESLVSAVLGGQTVDLKRIFLPDGQTPPAAP